MNQKVSFLLFSLFILLTSCGSNEEEVEERRSPGSRVNWSTTRFFHDGAFHYSPADFERMELKLTFHSKSREARGNVELQFKAQRAGLSYFLSDAKLEYATLDGEPVSLVKDRDPDNQNSIHVIVKELEEGRTYTLRAEYELAANRYSVSDSGIAFFTSMSDIGNGNFFEAYAPASFEDDAFELSLDIKVVGAKDAHHLYTNGEAKKLNAHHWKIEFPAYFTSSSFFVHFTNTSFFSVTRSYAGKNGSIPFTVYGKSESEVHEAALLIPEYFRELEQDYGAYPHARFLAYISGRGGMEYAGATITSISALGHELTHSWFGRGVIPSDGRSGWIDEAVASWRDNGYFRAKSIGRRPSKNLARFSAFARFTPSNAYEDGRNFLAELDYLFAASGGLRPILKEYVRRHERKNAHTEGLISVIEEVSSTSVRHWFQKYVYTDDGGFRDLTIHHPDLEKYHPILTEEELRAMR